MSAVAAMKQRLRSDLQAAMKDKRATEAGVLRLLLGAIDQAEAVPVSARARSAEGFRFGDPDVEVPRKTLSAEEVGAVLRKERDELRDVAEELARREQADAAAEHREKAAIIERYL